MYLHNESYITYLLFAKVQNSVLFSQSHPTMSKFDEKLYFSRDQIDGLSDEQLHEYSYYPVSVMVVEENFGIPAPVKCWCPESKIEHRNGHESGGPPRKTKMGIRKNSGPKMLNAEDNCMVIRLLATKGCFRRKGFGSVLLAKYLEQCKRQHKRVDYVYAVTRFNPLYFKNREEGNFDYMTSDLSSDMEYFYDDFKPPPSWTDYDRIMDVCKDLVNQDKKRVIIPLRLRNYDGLNKGYARLLQNFHFKHSSPYHDTFTNDQDNGLNLNYDGHVYILKIEKTCSYAGLSTLLQPSSGSKDSEQFYLFVNFSNRVIENLRYVKTDHAYNPGLDDDICFDDVYEHGYFETFNHMWHWTIVKKETLENDESTHITAKACVTMCK